MNNNSTRLPLLPPAPFALSLYSKRKWEFFKVQSKKRVAGFRDGSPRWFRQRQTILWLRAEDIVLREAVADSDFDVNEVSCVHILDWSKWEQWWSGRRYRDRNGWSRRTQPIDERFTVRNRRKNRINTDLDVADASQLDFFYWLFTPEMFATIAGQTNRYARVKFAAIPSLPCRK